MPHRAPASPTPFDTDFIAAFSRIWEESIPFNRVIGLKVQHVTPDRVSASIAMQPQLVGHPAYQRMHGGVISAGLDAVGGMAVMAAVAARHSDEALDVRLGRFAKLGTIDLRVDYLRPAIGEHFTLHAQVLRLGSRVASTRMEFLGADGTLLSTGAAAYIVS